MVRKTKKCLICGKEFSPRPAILKKGYGKFCSRKCYGEWVSKNIRGENAPCWKGGKIEIKCAFCNKIFKVYPCRIKAGRGKFCSTKCHGKWLKENMRGEKRYNWKGGITSENNRIRQSLEYSIWRREVYKRDGWTCRLCKNKNHKQIIAHHLKLFSEFPELRFAVENGITLCRSCHFKIHSPSRWKQ